MKTKLIFLLLIVTFSVSAQVKLGVKGGLNISNLSKSEWIDNGLSGTTDASSMILRFHAGGLVNYSFNNILGLQGELLFSRQGGSFSNHIIQQDYIILPILLDIKPIQNTSFSALIGPQIGYALNRQESSSNIGPYRRFDFAISTGIQYVFSYHFLCSLRYNIGITPSLDFPENISQDSKSKGQRNNVLQISFGYVF